MSNSGRKSRKSSTKSVKSQGGESNPRTNEEPSTSWLSSIFGFIWRWYKPQPPSNVPTPEQQSKVPPPVSTIAPPPPETEIQQPSVSPSIYPYPPFQTEATSPPLVSPSVYEYPPFQTEFPQPSTSPSVYPPFQTETQQPSVFPSVHPPFKTETQQPSVSPSVNPPLQTKATQPSASPSKNPPPQIEVEPDKPFWWFLWPWAYNKPSTNDPAVQQKASKLSKKSKSSTNKSKTSQHNAPTPTEKLAVKQQPNKKDDPKSSTSKTPPLPPTSPKEVGKQQQRDTKGPADNARRKSTKFVEEGTKGSSITRRVSSPAAIDEPVRKSLFGRAASFARKVPDILLSYTPWGNQPPSNEEETPGSRKSGMDTSKKSREKSLSTKSKSAPTLASRFSRSGSSKKEAKTRLPSQVYMEPVVEDKPLSYIPGIDVLVADTDETKFHDSSATESEAPTPPKPQTPIKLDDLNKKPIPLPKELAEDPRLKKSPESNWDIAFEELVIEATHDERFEPRKIVVFRHTDDHGDTINSDLDLDAVKLPKMAPKITDSTRLSTPFQYNLRPFRMPHLAVRQNDLDSEPDNLLNIYKFKSIKVDDRDWAMIRQGNEMRLATNKWTLQEPIRADKRLLPEIDPLVKYKLKRLGKNQVTPQELEKTQLDLVVGVTPSGRKLDGYSSGSAEECVYKRVLCKNDPEFDILHPYVETESGDKWPNPFLFYWNWKKTDENPNEPYLKNQRPDKDHELVQKRRVAIELESHPLKIPYVNLGIDDTDYEDPLGPLSITQSIKPKRSNKSRRSTTSLSGGGEIELEDPMTRRYPYMLLDQYTIFYRTYYRCRVLWQGQKRTFHQIYLGICGKHTSTCITLSSYPCWFYFWKTIIRHWVRRVPRSWKFCKERNVETVFYGTLASLFATQYIGEHDLLPNMDDPVNMSQLALEKALEIKEKFLVTPKSGRPYVDYIKLQRSKSYERYMEWIGLLCRYQPSKMPPRVRKAFFINYFNVLSIQTQIVRIPEKEYTKYLCEMKDFWGMTKGLVGYMELSLEEIYHGILRCNRLHPTKQVRVFQDHPVKGFPKEMNPSRLSLDWMDPRIHFALSVGCKSCPPIHSISLYEQDCQLDEVAKTYVRSRVKVDLEHRTVTLPILFLWYEKDFGNNKYIMLWYLKQFMLPNDILKIRQLLASKRSITLRYERFNEEIEHVVQRHPVTKCDPVSRRKNITVYWGSKF